MNEFIEKHRPELAALCRRHRVKTLEVFGSAAVGTFDPERSDLDFLVDFLPVEPGEIAPDYFGLLHALEDLFHCKIDLVMDRAIRNPYFRRGVDESRRTIYAALLAEQNADLTAIQRGINDMEDGRYRPFADFDAETYRRIRERQEAITDELRKKYGQMDIAVDLIREVRDES